MKKFVFALGLLATAAVAEADAGYIVVRIVLEGANSGPGDGSTMSGGGQPPGGKGVVGPLRPGGSSGGSSAGPPPMGGSLGGPPGMLPGMGPGAAPNAEPAHTDPTRSIYVVVPYTNDITAKPAPLFYPKLSFHPHQNPHWDSGISVKHPYGYGNLLYDNAQIQLYLELGPQAPKGRRTRPLELQLKRDAWLKKPLDAQIYLELLNETLENGLVNESLAMADELIAAVREKNAKANPLVDRFIRAWEQVKDAVRKPARLASDGPIWKQRIGGTYTNPNDYTSQHYYLIYWDATEEERSRRIAQLEENFKAFFLVHALRGVALTVPDRPLVAVLAKSGQDVRRLSASLDGLPTVADAFYAPDHGLLVLSPSRLDAVGQTFQRQIQQVYREGVSRGQLLKGDGPKLDTTGMRKDAQKPEDVARMMTWALVERYADEEAEWSGVSREASRQLLHATGRLPQHVALPQWLAEGSASFFHRPKGPVFCTKEEHTYFTIGLTTGYGGPNFARQKQFSELIRLKQLNADPGQIVRNAVSDAYVNAVWGGLDADDAKLPLPIKKAKPPATGVGPTPVAPPAAEDPIAVKRQRQEFLVSKAFATSWALYYYLAKYESEGLDRYLAELNKLPRDLPLDEPTRLAAFARAFGLTTPESFAALGVKWLQMMESIPPAGVEIQLADLAAPTTTSGSGPMLPPGAGGTKPGGGD